MLEKHLFICLKGTCSETDRYLSAGSRQTERDKQRDRQTDRPVCWITHQMAKTGKAELREELHPVLPNEWQGFSYVFSTFPRTLTRSWSGSGVPKTIYKWHSDMGAGIASCSLTCATKILPNSLYLFTNI